MKELLNITLCLAVLTGFGCAITDYGIITDNNQSKAGGSGPNPVINTTGKAHILEIVQVALLWPDGSDEIMNFVDQKADGTATLTTYNNFSTGIEPIFHDDLYCNPDWSGCAIFTAPDDNDANLFDGTFNPNCSGARSLSVLVSTGRYYGECGREAKLSLRDKATLFSTAVEAKMFGRRGLAWDINSVNASFVAKNMSTGQSYFVPTFGANIRHFQSESGNIAFTDITHSMVGPALLHFTSMLESELSSEGIEVTITLNGVSAAFRIAGGQNDLVRRHFALSSRRF